MNLALAAALIAMGVAQQAPPEKSPTAAPTIVTPQRPTLPQPQNGPLGVGAENRPAPGEITPELTAAIERGLVYLASSQNGDGSFGRGRY